MIEVTGVRHIQDYKLRLEFSDGTSGSVDLEHDLEGEVFGPLKDKNLFASVHLDRELGTIAWPNGADLAPEYLKSIAENWKESA